ncbi:hypothetical protein [Corallococcus silvisoli]|uniref:hypothetical protein n=1 Tax=Corallococcus silvisoli TaxID=2697031 RepID=UPI0013790954|nr:hypothetical protein [Corallococcus silvisoli]NBD12838.1 hypothetical protein [Corallococcus silvisoli]
MSLEVPVSAAVPCVAHPEVLAGGTCSRCGGFMCAACSTAVLGLEGQRFCAACAARPDVNYLEALRQRFWGRRDGWTWTVGFVTLLLCVGAIACFVAWGLGPTWHTLLAVLMLAAAPVGVAFFLGRPWARHALLLPPLVMAWVMWTQVSQPLWFLLLCASPGMLVAWGIHRDVRNQLFFQRPVTAKALRVLWDRRLNNPLARQALRLGVNAVLMPLLAPFAVIFGAVALTRVDLKASPPIDRRGYAIGGMLLGIVILSAWGYVLRAPLRDIARWLMSREG